MCVVLLLMFLVINKPDQDVIVQSEFQEIESENVSTSTDTDAKLNPLLKFSGVDDVTEIEPLMSQVVEEEIREYERLQVLQQAEERLRELKKSGKQLWANANVWMKDSDYYAALSTEELATECFTMPEGIPVFGFEVGLYDDPKRGLLRLEIMHNGFSELFQREDLVEGVLRAYEVLIGKIDPSSSKEDVFSAALQLESLPSLYKSYERFQTQMVGKESCLLEANISALAKFIYYMENTEKGDIPIYGEPVELVKFSIRLIKDTFGDIAASEISKSIETDALEQLGVTSVNQDIDVLVKYLKIAYSHLYPALLLDGVYSVDTCPFVIRPLSTM